MSELLTAEQYREALALVLAELEELDARQPLEVAERVGRLKAHVQTIIGEQPGMEPIYGLRAFRRHRKEVTPSETP
jgi:hypothetical protein